VIAQPPLDDVAVPPAVVAMARGQALQPLWHNELGGLTYGVGDDLVVKWSPPALDLTPERERLAWASAYVVVPEVVDHDADDDGSWLITRRLPGQNAVSPRWTAQPATAVAALAQGLRALHDRLPVEDCPFSWSVADRLTEVADSAARDALTAAPDVDRLVVCHGDACAPNTLLDDDGEWSGHVDLGSLGVADRWADLAVATWSTVWNYGPGWEGALLDAYGVASDAERTAYYRALWDAGP
jgi:kanamycin kinase